MAARDQLDEFSVMDGYFSYNETTISDSKNSCSGPANLVSYGPCHMGRLMAQFSSVFFGLSLICYLLTGL